MTEIILKKHNDEKDQLLTAREAHNQLRISKWKLYDLIRNKKIKIGRRRLFFNNPLTNTFQNFGRIHSSNSTQKWSADGGGDLEL